MTGTRHDGTSAGQDDPSVRRLGDFEILGELGRGGMGVVYDARQLSLGLQVSRAGGCRRVGIDHRADIYSLAASG